MDSTPKRIRPKQFAEMMGCAVATLYRRIDSGQIQKPMRDGGCVYWLDSYVRQVVTQTDQR
jgi:predicted DNA-binding transcriptional regulator AlpA